ncbi:MAG: hypothetical protein LBK94_06715 [Prevotellaceae bacterium]|jgi:hypothetical protein|nr:hypothetical protein [Prevotellaceae bacterium]
MDLDVKRYGSQYGIASGNGTCISFKLCSDSSIDSIIDGRTKSTQAIMPEIFKVDRYNVLSFGPDNREPNRVRDIIGKNRLLPELIEKQVRFLYGQGYYLYKHEVQENKPVRIPLSVPTINQWLDSWRENGIADGIDIYINKAIRDFYYMEGIWNKWRMYKSRRIGGILPVAGLETVNPTRCRFASTKDIDYGNYDDADFNYVLIGNWDNLNKKTLKVYPQFDYSNPNAFGVSISYNRNPSFGEDIYAYNKYFRGIEDWLKGANLTPSYINSFYENSLSVKLHVIIPYAWVDKKRVWLEELCSANAERQESNKDLIKVNGIDIGVNYSEDIMNKYVDSEIDKFTQYLSGAKNQGKAYFSYSTPGEDGKELSWRIEDVPLKYKEFISTLIDYDKRADEVLLSSKGVDASLSNISKDGVTSNSGANVFYNYMVYIATLYTAESVVLDAIQFALKLNFPKEHAEGIRIGILSLNNVQRLENTSPGDRMQNNNV